MGFLKEWAFSVCAACTCGAIAYMLSPDGNLQKIYKFCVNLFFLFSVITPFFMGGGMDFSVEDLDIQSDLSARQAYSEKLDEQVLGVFALNLENSVKQELSSMGIEAQKISINLNIEEDNSICITQIELYTAQENLSKEQEIQKIVQELTGSTCQIVWTKEDVDIG